MRIESFLSWRSHRISLTSVGVACLAAWSVAIPMTRVEAGSLVIPAWSFARGNARIYADPDEYADAGSCSECHDPDEGDEETPKRADAFHQQCAGCHEGYGAGPLEKDCSACHVR